MLFENNFSYVQIEKNYFKKEKIHHITSPKVVL